MSVLSFLAFLAFLRFGAAARFAFARRVSGARLRFGAKAGGPYLYGAFGAADAMYAPVATRFRTYGVSLDPVSAAYCEAIFAWPAFKEWEAAALSETAIIEFDVFQKAD